MDEILDPRRGLTLVGAHNVRDLGGYRTQSGEYTRWGRFLRAATMHRLSAEDQSALVEYGLRSAVDLRRTSETESAPNVFAQSAAVAYHHLNMIGDADLDTGPEPDDPARRIAQGYCGWLDLRQDMIREILDVLSAGPHAVLFHCAAGKDRTGVVAALLLGLAGVPEQTIIADYSLTARFSIDSYRQDPAADPAIRTWEDYQRQICPPETMRLVLDHLEQRYGGVEPYMRQIGLSEESIRRLRDTLVA